MFLNDDRDRSGDDYMTLFDVLNWGIGLITFGICIAAYFVFC